MPTCSSTSRRTSRPAVFAASTTRRTSCWPWSYSPRSRPVSRRPLPEMVTPSSSRRRSEGHSRSLGPNRLTPGLSSARLRAGARGRAGRGRCRRAAARPTPARRRRSPWDPLQAELDALGVRRQVVDLVHVPDPVAAQHLDRLVARTGVDGRRGARGCAVCCSTPATTAGSQRAPLWLTRRTETCTTDQPMARTPSRAKPVAQVRSQRGGSLSPAQTARFFSLRRSRSDRPPQIPKRSSLASA